MHKQNQIELEQEILQIWNERIVPLCKRFEENDRLKAKYQIGEDSCVSIYKANKRKPGPKLKVTFNDGSCLEQGTNGLSAVDILLQAIHKVGSTDIIQHNITASGINLIQDNCEYISKGLKPIGNYWVVTKTSTKEKKVQLDQIKELSNGIITSIELIESE